MVIPSMRLSIVVIVVYSKLSTCDRSDEVSPLFTILIIAVVNWLSRYHGNTSIHLPINHTYLLPSLSCLTRCPKYSKQLINSFFLLSPCCLFHCDIDQICSRDLPFCFPVANWLFSYRSDTICDMIKRNESDVGHVVFEILVKQCSNSFVLYCF